MKSLPITIALWTVSGILSASAQPVVQTLQTFSIGPHPDGWKFNFQMTRFLPTNPGDTLAQVQVDLIVHTDFPGFTVTSTKVNPDTQDSQAHWDITETVSVKNLQINSDDGCDDDEDQQALRVIELGSEYMDDSKPLSLGASQVVPGVAADPINPAIVLTQPEDLKQFIGNPNNPKSLNIKLINKQTRSFTWKPGDGTFSPARKDYHPQTSATLVITYFTQTTSDVATVNANYASNASSLIHPMDVSYQCSSHQ